MTIQEALKKAIEGGYKNDNVQALIYHLVDEPDLYFEQYGVPENHVSIDTLLLDPLFWQALGKSLGWRQYQHHDDIKEEWEYYWHQLINHLADGITIEEYFEKL